MNTEIQKLEIIEWILQLQDSHLFKELVKLKSTKTLTKTATRKFGCGKGIFSFVADDFNEPLPQINF